MILDAWICPQCRRVWAAWVSGCAVCNGARQAQEEHENHRVLRDAFGPLPGDTDFVASPNEKIAEDLIRKVEDGHRRVLVHKECGTELPRVGPMIRDCPGCQKSFDWYTDTEWREVTPNRRRDQEASE